MTCFGLIIYPLYPWLLESESVFKWRG